MRDYGGPYSRRRPVTVRPPGKRHALQRLEQLELALRELGAGEGELRLERPEPPQPRSVCGTCGGELCRWCGMVCHGCSQKPGRAAARP